MLMLILMLMLMPVLVLMFMLIPSCSCCHAHPVLSCSCSHAGPCQVPEDGEDTVNPAGLGQRELASDSAAFSAGTDAFPGPQGVAYIAVPAGRFARFLFFSVLRLQGIMGVPFGLH
jgi:hypothetical protein